MTAAVTVSPNRPGPGFYVFPILKFLNPFLTRPYIVFPVRWGFFPRRLLLPIAAITKSIILLIEHYFFFFFFFSFFTDIRECR